MLYGISTSFPVLSRLERQVAHALLTRPPLSKFKQAWIYSVRLECVMHAASVHPEPGSNSRLKSLYLSYLLIYCSHLGIVEILGCQVSLASSFVLFFVLSYFVLSLNRCSIFKDHFALSRAVALFASAWLLYHFYLPLSTSFFAFFEICLILQ